MDVNATNYNSEAEIDDGSCEYPEPIEGCMDVNATNYDSEAEVEDGSCEYTVPAVSDLNAEDGPERAILSWTAPSQMGDASYTYDVVSGGEVVKGDLIGTSTQVLNLEPDVEACFTVVAKNIYGESAASNEACCLPFEAAGMTWGFQVTASIDGFGSFDESDEGELRREIILENVTAALQKGLLVNITYITERVLKSIDNTRSDSDIVPLLNLVGALYPSLKAQNRNPRPCLLYTSPSPRDGLLARMPSSA